MNGNGNCLYSVASSVPLNQLPVCIMRQESMAVFKVSLKTLRSAMASSEKMLF